MAHNPQNQLDLHPVQACRHRMGSLRPEEPGAVLQPDDLQSRDRVSAACQQRHTGVSDLADKYGS